MNTTFTDTLSIKKKLTYTLNIDSKEICSEIHHDTIPISSIQGNSFLIHKDFVTFPPCPININSFKQYITTISQWKRILISKYEENIVNSSLAAAIQMKQKIIIASDGSKSKSVSGGAWIIVDMMGKIIISDTNTDFGHITQIHSHQSEIYGVFSIFLFIQEYSKYYMIPFLSKVTYYYDNLEVVHKINTLANNPNSFNKQYKTTDHDAVLQLKECSPPNITVSHVKGHQDKRMKWEHLTISVCLNIQVDELIGDNAKASLNKHIFQTSMATYVKGKYIPKNYVNVIRSACGETDSKAFLTSKHRWNKSKNSDIEWELHAQYITKQTYFRKKTLLKFVHRWLASGNK